MKRVDNKARGDGPTAPLVFPRGRTQPPPASSSHARRDHHRRQPATVSCVRKPMVLGVPIAHPWAKRGAGAIEVVHAQPIITREPGSGTRALVETVFQRIGALPRIEMELSLNVVIKQAVEAGIGVEIMPESIVRDEVDAGRLACIKIRDCRFAIEIDWVFLKDRALKDRARRHQSFEPCCR